MGQLLTSGKWSTVTTIGRKEVSVPDSYTDVKAQLQQRTVDMDKMEEAADAFQGASAVFCALGTTRAVGGPGPSSRSASLPRPQRALRPRRREARRRAPGSWSRDHVVTYLCPVPPRPRPG